MFSYGVSLTTEEEEVIADLIATYGEEIMDITNSIFERYKKIEEIFIYKSPLFFIFFFVFNS